MCSNNEELDDSSLQLIPQEEPTLLDEVALCQKCNLEKAAILLRKKDVYCNNCFLASATHKFRATLGKSKIVRPTDIVLVAYTGNAGSAALLHLIKAGMHESVHKRLVFKTKVFYIDDGAVKGQNLEDRKARVRKIGQQIDALGFESYAASLGQSLNEADQEIVELKIFSRTLRDDCSKADETLKNIFVKLPDCTSKIELLRKLHQKLIFSAAKRLKCNKVFLVDDSTSLAIEILGNVALGRGAQLSLDVGFLDTRYADVIMLRPMRDFTRHELKCYLNIHELETADSGDLENSAESPQSIQSLTEKFVTDLDSRFHGTVSTVFRTGEKVCAASSGKPNRNSSDDTCVLCDAPLDTLASDTVISAIQATAFSRLVSSQGPNRNIDLGEIQDIASSSLRTDETFKPCGKCNGACNKTNSREILVTPEEVRKFLCYGCRLIFKTSNIDDLPAFVFNAVLQRLTLENMRGEITDFLL